MAEYYAVIMAGGKGERFWPLSTAEHPKQALSIFGGEPMLRKAFNYLSGLIPPSRILVITSHDMAGLTRMILPELPGNNVIGEPFGRDTAAVCALAWALVSTRDADASFCVLTADHIIGDVHGFRRVLSASLDMAAKSSRIITIGIKPSFPSTGFGYIEAGVEEECVAGTRFLNVARFVEKPDPETAARYLASGSFFWNAGMFAWSIETLRAALAEFQPGLMAMARRLQDSVDTDGFPAALRSEYEKLVKISIDYAILEKAGNILVAPGDFEWDDVGAWPALRNHFKPDGDGNITLGSVEVIDSRSNIVVSEGRLTALIGVDDLVVAHSGNATLVCPANRAQDVKKMVKMLEGRNIYSDYL